MSNSTQFPPFDPIEIPLMQGGLTLVDPIDGDLAQHRWRINRYGYACKRQKTDGHITIHRIVMSRMLGVRLKPSQIVDHIDANKLNNRRDNLRLADHSQNNFNRSPSAKNTSGYKGVTWHKQCQKWQVVIRAYGKSHYLGLYTDPVEAHKVYCEAAVKYHGEFARFV